MSGHSSQRLSQELSQRFSQRQGSQIPRSQKGAVADYFFSVVNNCGVNVTNGARPNVFTQEQTLVARDIERELSKDDALKDNSSLFVKGLRKFCSKEKYFTKVLEPTILKKVGNENAIEVPQESLLRMFLKISPLQSEIIKFIFDEIIVLATEETEDTSRFRLLLYQLRYLPQLENAKELSTQIHDILEISTIPHKLEILDAIPEILPDSEYNATATRLCELLNNDDNLTCAFIDCLSALNIDSDIRAKVQDQVLAKLISGNNIKELPILLAFLLSDYKSQNLMSTFVKIRTALDNIMSSSDKDKEKESIKILIFNKLQASAHIKIVSETWINLITQIKVHTDHKPIDYLLLFMLHSVTNLRKRAIENIIRKRVKDGLFKCSHLRKLFEKYFNSQLLKDYFSSICETAGVLLRTSTENAVIEFASTLFKLLFNHPQIETIYRQELLDNLILLTGASDGKKVNPVLKILTDLLDDVEKIRQHTVLLMRLLEKLDTFTLSEIKQVFEILCALTCTDDYGFKNEIHIIIRKQLQSSKKSIKHRGIVTAVVMAKYLAIVEEEPSETSISEDSTITVANIPPGKAREAGTLLELAYRTTEDCPDLLGFYYDQLAAMILTPKHFDKYFMNWLFESITSDFQTIYVDETFRSSINDLELSSQYNLNNESEMDGPISLKIAELTLEPKNGQKILVLAPHFKLLRLLHYRLRDGDLTSIDALLGCGVILPRVVNLEDLDSDQLEQVADCIFHCINWFREVISGFVKQTSANLRTKVLQRLANLIELEKLLKRCLQLIPQHKLPQCYFDSSLTGKQLSPKDKKVVKPSKKKLKPSQTIIDGPSTSTTIKPTQTQQNTKQEKIQSYEINFREIDTDIVTLFKYPLNFGEPSEKRHLTIQQLKFLLSDYALKLEKLTKNENLGLSHLNIVKPNDLIEDSKEVLPRINPHLTTILKRIDEIQQSHSDDFDTEDNKDLKACFGLILEIFYLTFSWSGFQHPQNLNLLQNILRSLRDSQEPKLHSANRLTIEFINKLTTYVDKCLRLKHGVSLLKIMEALQAIIEDPEIDRTICKTSEELLNRRWYNEAGGIDFGKGSSANIDVLVKCYLKSVSVEKIGTLVETLKEQAPNLKAKNDFLDMLRSINKPNLVIFYRNLCQSLQDRVKVEALTHDLYLVLWKTVATTMQNLMAIAKATGNRNILVCFLKKSIAVLKIFLSKGIPVLEKKLRSKPDDVVDIFKTFQASTRFLHHLCCASKLTKDQSIMAYVPQFRLTIETLVYQVKATLVANNCSEAFIMGNLKNRDLQGEDIISQSTTTTEEGEEEEELPNDDDDDSDEEIFNDTEQKSCSEVYD